MTDHDAKIIVEDAVRDLHMSHRAELVVPVSAAALDAIRRISGQGWFAQRSSVLYREGKTIRFVRATEVAA